MVQQLQHKQLKQPQYQMNALPKTRRNFTILEYLQFELPSASESYNSNCWMKQCKNDYINFWFLVNQAFKKLLIS